MVLIQCINRFNFKNLWKSDSCSVMTNSLWTHGLYSPWNSQGQKTGVGSLSLLQQIFPTQDGTGVSCIAGRFFISWAIREAHYAFITSSTIKVIPRGLRGASFTSPSPCHRRFPPRGIRLRHCLPETLSRCDFSPEVLLTQLMQPSTFWGDKSMNGQHITLHDGVQCGPTWSYHRYHVSIPESLVWTP